MSYLAFRIGTKILRVSAPLLLILALSFAPIGVSSATAKSWVGLGTFLTFLVAFLAYVRFRSRCVLLPGIVVWIGLAAWLGTSFLNVNPTPYIFGLIPIPFLVLLLPKVWTYFTPPGAKSGDKCLRHVMRDDGFCDTCGVRLSAPRAIENFGPWGLVAVAAVTVLLLFASVPALAFVGGVPYNAVFTPHGVSHSVIDATPSGWQENSTTLQEFPGQDLYGVVNVYVPLAHPETKNYTVYFEVASILSYSTSLPVSSAPIGSAVVGWTWIRSEPVQIGPYQGHITTYTTSHDVMLSYQGKTQMLFMNNGTFDEYYVGLGFVRVFKNSNITADTTQFLGDIQTLWLPTFKVESSYSDWTGFLSETYDGAVSSSPFLLLVSSLGVMAWLSAQAWRRDERLDRFLTLSSVQSRDSWAIITRLFGRKNHTGTSLDLTNDGMLDQSGGSPSVVLKELEQRRLVTRRLIEEGSDIRLVWKTVE